MKEHLKTYWDNLNERERWMLGFGGVFCALFLLYMLIVAPLVNAVHTKSRLLIEKQETLVWMQQAHRQDRAVKEPQFLSNSALLSVLGEQLKSTSFHAFPYQLQQTGTGDIQLSFDQVPYNAFVTWLWSVRQNYAFSIKQFNTEKTDKAGVVKIMLTVQTLPNTTRHTQPQPRELSRTPRVIPNPAPRPEPRRLSRTRRPIPNRAHTPIRSEEVPYTGRRPLPPFQR